ncbi:hypothetical protein ACFL6X_03995, partial [Candidatus Latescibacterota bacterium]
DAAGRADAILTSDHPERLHDLESGARVAPRFGVVSRRPHGTIELFALAGSRVELPEGTLTIARPTYRGQVLDFHREEAGPAWIDLAPGRGQSVPAGDRLAGAQIKVLSSGPRDCCYAVERVEESDGAVRLWVGDTSFIRGLQSETDYSLGYLYDFEVGDAVEIPTLVHLQLGGGEAVEVAATVDWEWTPAG